jgi:DNA-binding NarL/FixJ family response regulator
LSDTVPELPIRVFLLIENRLLRDALERLFLKRLDFQVVGCGEPEGHSRQAAEIGLCDVVVLDFFDSCCKALHPGAKVGDSSVPKAVLIGMSEDSESFLAAIRGGVAGYLLKEASAAEVVAAVRATHRGEAVCPPKLCATLFHYVSKFESLGLAASGVAPRRPSLTLRQQRLIALVAKGLTNKEIASRLNISEFTVKNHIHRILKNVDAGSRGEAVEAVRLRGYSLMVEDNPRLRAEAAGEAALR